MKVIKNILLLVAVSLTSIILNSCKNDNIKAAGHRIIGWNILSSNYNNALKVINTSSRYGVNHLQLSHEIIHDLREIKDPSKQKLVNNLIVEAHKNGIPEVVVWDHALYPLNYYPDSFKSAEGGKLNLDNPALWNWIKEDYRKMLKLIPEVNGIVLTFIETGARIENQYSEKLSTSSQKQAALIDSLASVIINEFHLNMYIRTFVYNRDELSSILDCIEQIKNPNVIAMCKETPHDFFITHPVSQWIQNIKIPVVIEFDCAHEFNGQGVVASIFPEVHFRRWEYYQSLSNVIGFSIRTDRYGTSTVIDHPSEINLFAIHCLAKNPQINIETVYDEFIIQKYGKKVLEPVKKIFKLAPEIMSSVYYTLGLNTCNHSSLNYDYRSIYSRHVSGRWMENPSISINHNINKEFQYWIDVVNHLSPARHKEADAKNLMEIPEVIENKWIQPNELMTEEYLKYVITEKKYGSKISKDVLKKIKEIKNDFDDPKTYKDLFDTFERTEISSRLFLGMAKAYFSYRIFNRGKEFRSRYVEKNLMEGLNEILNVSLEIENYKNEYPIGQYDWKKDAEIAMEFYNEVQKHTSNLLLNKYE